MILRLDPYRHAINHARQYPEDDGFQSQVETVDKEVYISKGRLVKAWLNVGGQGYDPGQLISRF